MSTDSDRPRQHDLSRYSTRGHDVPPFPVRGVQGGWRDPWEQAVEQMVAEVRASDGEDALTSTEDDDEEPGNSLSPGADAAATHWR